MKSRVLPVVLLTFVLCSLKVNADVTAEYNQTVASLASQQITLTPSEQTQLRTWITQRDAAAQKIQGENAQLHTDLAAVSTKIAASVAEIGKAQDAQTKADAAINQKIKDDPTDNTASFLGFQRPTNAIVAERAKIAATYQAAFDKNNTDIANLQRLRKAYQADHDTRINKINNSTSGIPKNVQDAVKADATQQIQDINGKIDKMSLDDDFQNAYLYNERLGYAVQRLSDRLDKMAIGAYMQKKETDLLKSPSFCTAQAGCTNKSANNGVGDAQLNSLFNSTSPAGSGSRAKINAGNSQ